MSDVKSILKAARSALQEQQYDEAIKQCKAAIRIEKDNYFAYVIAGKAAFGLNELEQAEKAYTKASAISPDNAAAYQGLLEIYEKKSDTGAKINVIRTLHRVSVTNKDAAKAAEYEQTFLKLCCDINDVDEISRWFSVNETTQDMTSDSVKMFCDVVLPRLIINAAVVRRRWLDGLMALKTLTAVSSIFPDIDVPDDVTTNREVLCNELAEWGYHSHDKTKCLGCLSSSPIACHCSFESRGPCASACKSVFDHGVPRVIRSNPVYTALTWLLYVDKQRDNAIVSLIPSVLACVLLREVELLVVWSKAEYAWYADDDGNDIRVCANAMQSLIPYAQSEPMFLQTLRRMSDIVPGAMPSKACCGLVHAVPWSMDAWANMKSDIYVNDWMSHANDNTYCVPSVSPDETFLWYCRKLTYKSYSVSWLESLMLLTVSNYTSCESVCDTCLTSHKDAMSLRFGSLSASYVKNSPRDYAVHCPHGYHPLICGCGYSRNNYDNKFKGEPELQSVCTWKRSGLDMLAAYYVIDDSYQVIQRTLPTVAPILLGHSVINGYQLCTGGRRQMLQWDVITLTIKSISQHRRNRSMQRYDTPSSPLLLVADLMSSRRSKSLMGSMLTLGNIWLSCDIEFELKHSCNKVLDALDAASPSFASELSQLVTHIKSFIQHRDILSDMYFIDAPSCGTNDVVQLSKDLMNGANNLLNVEQAHLWAGYSLMKMHGDHDLTMNYFNHAIKLQPGLPEPYVYCALYTGDLKYHKRALDSAPFCKEVGISAIRAIMTDPNHVLEAVALCNNVIRDCPSATWALESLASILTSVGRVDDSILLLHRACRLSPSFTSWAHLAHCLLAAHKYTSAYQACVRALTYAPAGVIQSSLLHDIDDDYDVTFLSSGSESRRQKVVKIEPDLSSGGTKGLAKYKYSLSANHTEDFSEETAITLCCLAGSCLKELGRWREAIPWYEAVLSKQMSETLYLHVHAAYEETLYDYGTDLYRCGRADDGARYLSLSLDVVMNKLLTDRCNLYAIPYQRLIRSIVFLGTVFDSRPIIKGMADKIKRCISKLLLMYPQYGSHWLGAVCCLKCLDSLDTFSQAFQTRVTQDKDLLVSAAELLDRPKPNIITTKRDHSTLLRLAATAAYVNPKSSRSWIILGDLSKDLNVKRHCYVKATRASPRSIAAWSALGVLFSVEQRYKAAMMCFRAADMIIADIEKAKGSKGNAQAADLILHPLHHLARLSAHPPMYMEHSAMCYYCMSLIMRNQPKVSEALAVSGAAHSASPSSSLIRTFVLHIIRSPLVLESALHASHVYNTSLTYAITARVASDMMYNSAAVKRGAGAGLLMPFVCEFSRQLSRDLSLFNDSRVMDAFNKCLKLVSSSSTSDAASALCMLYVCSVVAPLLVSVESSIATVLNKTLMTYLSVIDKAINEEMASSMHAGDSGGVSDVLNAIGESFINCWDKDANRLGSMFRSAANGCTGGCLAINKTVIALVVCQLLMANKDYVKAHAILSKQSVPNDTHCRHASDVTKSLLTLRFLLANKLNDVANISEVLKSQLKMSGDSGIVTYGTYEMLFWCSLVQRDDRACVTFLKKWIHAYPYANAPRCLLNNYFAASGKFENILDPSIRYETVQPLSGVGPVSPQTKSAASMLEIDPQVDVVRRAMELSSFNDDDGYSALLSKSLAIRRGGCSSDDRCKYDDAETSDDLVMMTAMTPLDVAKDSPVVVPSDKTKQIKEQAQVKPTVSTGQTSEAPEIQRSSIKYYPSYRDGEIAIHLRPWDSDSWLSCCSFAANGWSGPHFRSWSCNTLSVLNKNLNDPQLKLMKMLMMLLSGVQVSEQDLFSVIKSAGAPKFTAIQDHALSLMGIAAARGCVDRQTSAKMLIKLSATSPRALVFLADLLRIHGAPDALIKRCMSSAGIDNCGNIVNKTSIDSDMLALVSVMSLVKSKADNKVIMTTLQPARGLPWSCYYEIYANYRAQEYYGIVRCLKDLEPSRLIPEECALIYHIVSVVKSIDGYKKMEQKYLSQLGVWGSRTSSKLKSYAVHLMPFLVYN